MTDKMAQNRMVITFTDDQERAVRCAYARYIMTVKKPITMNKWIVNQIMTIIPVGEAPVREEPVADTAENNSQDDTGAETEEDGGCPQDCVSSVEQN